MTLEKAIFKTATNVCNIKYAYVTKWIKYYINVKSPSTLLKVYYFHESRDICIFCLLLDTMCIRQWLAYTGHSIDVYWMSKYN